MRKLGVMVVGLLMAMPGTAFADHDYDSRDRYGHGSDYGGNEREEEYGDNSCKYVCPAFEDSPVQDAFNFGPQICLPGATCHFEDRERRQQEQPQEGEQGARER